MIKIPFILHILPIISICFVLLLIVYKGYFRIRSRFNVQVNCWFCNRNTKVQYLKRNGWDCPHCDQYNGFTKDGDYNREIIEQLDCSRSNENHVFTTKTLVDDYDSANGFCDSCNENQRLKVEKLSQFEPKRESNFDNEISVYKAQLEKQYRLCPTCERHLGKVLRDKKKMILGSKLLDFIVKGAENLSKHPRLKISKRAQQTKFKTFIRISLLIMAIVNFFIIIKDLSGLIRKGLGKEFSDPFVRFILIIITHMLAIMKLLQTYLDKFLKNDFLQKLYLFVKTLIILFFNGLGWRLPKDILLYGNQNNFSTIGIPFGSILLAFVHSFLDGFQLTRYTLILTVWSVYAGAINSDYLAKAEIFKLITSILALILSLPQWKNSTQITTDANGNSFHKMYSDYLTDNDDSSILNQSVSSNKSFSNSLCSTPRLAATSSSSSSQFNLHKKSPISPFKRLTTVQDDRHTSSCHNRFTPIQQQFLSNRSLFSSNLELNRSLRNSNHFHNQSFCCTDNRNLQFPDIPENDDIFNQSLSGSNRNLLIPATTHFESNRNFDRNNITIMPTMQYQSAEQINSPFSYATRNGSVYGGGCETGAGGDNYNRNNLLSPSRFSSMTSNRFGSQPSWVSGGFFNNCPQKSPDKQNCFHNIPAPLNSENLSRASSQSSGFESHASSNHNNGFVGHNNIGGGLVGRENSCFKDFDYQSTYSGDNFLFQQPLTTNFNSNFSNYSRASVDTTYREPSLFKSSVNIPKTIGSPSLQNLNNSFHCSSNLTRPLSVNCNSEFDWRQKSNRDLTSINSFNLNKINEELPAIQRGSLLRKWKQQQNCLI